MTFQAVSRVAATGIAWPCNAKAVVKLERTRSPARLRSARSRQARSWKRTELLSSAIESEAAACPFCSLADTKVWAENAHARAFFDRFPVADGHTLVIPRKHVSSVFAISDPEYAALWALVAEVRQRLLETHAADAFNVRLKRRRRCRPDRGARPHPRHPPAAR